MKTQKTVPVDDLVIIVDGVKVTLDSASSKSDKERASELIHELKLGKTLNCHVWNFKGLKMWCDHDNEDGDIECCRNYYESYEEVVENLLELCDNDFNKVEIH